MAVHRHQKAAEQLMGIRHSLIVIDELLRVRHEKADTIQNACTALLENALRFLWSYDLNVVCGGYPLRPLNGSIEYGITRGRQMFLLRNGYRVCGDNEYGAVEDV